MRDAKPDQHLPAVDSHTSMRKNTESYYSSCRPFLCYWYLSAAHIFVQEASIPALSLAKDKMVPEQDRPVSLSSWDC
jgi:hypothetical protein